MVKTNRHTTVLSLWDVLPFSPTSTYKNWLMALQKRSKTWKKEGRKRRRGERGRDRGKGGAVEEGELVNRDSSCIPVMNSTEKVLIYGEEGAKPAPIFQDKIATYLSLVTQTCIVQFRRSSHKKSSVFNLWPGFPRVAKDSVTRLLFYTCTFFNIPSCAAPQIQMCRRVGGWLDWTFPLVVKGSNHSARSLPQLNHYSARSYPLLE